MVSNEAEFIKLDHEFVRGNIQKSLCNIYNNESRILCLIELLKKVKKGYS